MNHCDKCGQILGFADSSKILHEFSTLKERQEVLHRMLKATFPNAQSHLSS